MPDDLAAFINARLDDEQEAARAAAFERGGSWLPCDFPSAGAHIARQDLQATLDRVEATRLVVAMHQPRLFQSFNGEDQELDPPYDCTVCWDVTDESARWPCPTLRALAWTWRRHEAWRAEWAPDGVEVAG